MEVKWLITDNFYLNNSYPDCNALSDIFANENREKKGVNWWIEKPRNLYIKLAISHQQIQKLHLPLANLKCQQDFLMNHSH